MSKKEKKVSKKLQEFINSIAVIGNSTIPNDDSIKSKNRLFAYNVCKMWIENNIVAN